MSLSDKYPCPCCGYLVFDGPPGSYDCCKICFWEDDASQLRFLDRSGANFTSLIEAQKNFAQFGASDERSLSHVHKPLPSETREPGWRPVEPSRDLPRRAAPGERYVPDTLDYPDDMTALYYWRPTFWRR